MLIDRDEVIKAIKQYGKSAIAEGRKSLDADDDIVKLIRLIRAIPTEDAVAVVRCRDCKYGKADNVNDIYYCTANFPNGCSLFGKGFCSYGERKKTNRKTGRMVKNDS